MAAVVKGIILVSLKCKLQGIRNLNLKKPRERQKLSYLATKNSTFARFAWAFSLPQSFLSSSRHEMRCPAAVWRTWALDAIITRGNFLLSLNASSPLLPRSIVSVLDLYELTPSVFSIASRSYATSSSSTISSLGSLRKDKGNGNEDATPKYNNTGSPL